MATSRGLKAFARRMKVVANQVDTNVSLTVRRAAIAADQTAVLATPVDTGRARASWRVGVGSPVFFDDPEASDLSGVGTIADGVQSINGWNSKDGAIYISNGIPYILQLDQGSSAQAPNGMSSLAVQSATAVLRNGGLLNNVD